MDSLGYKVYLFLTPLVILTWFGCTRPVYRDTGMRDQNPSPMVDHIRLHGRITEREWRGMKFEVDQVLDQPITIFIPDRETESGFQIVWIHFHGAEFILQSALSGAAEPMIGVHIHLGSGSSVYEMAFSQPSTFTNLVDTIIERCRRNGLWLHPEHMIYLSSFSAGYGAIRSILSTHAEEIKGILLLDGLHTDYIPGRVPVYEGGQLSVNKLEPFTGFARWAAEGRKKMVITHSEIFPGTYASTTETADFIIGELGLERQAVLEWGPQGMQMIARTHSNGLMIYGFAGNSAPDHMDHLHGLPFFLNHILEQH